MFHTRSTTVHNAGHSLEAGEKARPVKNTATHRLHPRPDSNGVYWNDYYIRYVAPFEEGKRNECAGRGEPT